MAGDGAQPAGRQPPRGHAGAGGRGPIRAVTPRTATPTGRRRGCQHLPMPPPTRPKPG